MYDFDNTPQRRGTNSLKWDIQEDELPLWVADMDFAVAPEITEAIVARAKHGVFGYTVVSEEWSKAIVSWWKRRHGFEMDESWLQFCTGVVPAISCIVKRVTNLGDRVAVLTPAYDIFYHSIENAGRQVAECKLAYQNGVYTLDFAALEKTLSHPLTTMLIFCNPHNPTGNIWTREEIARVGELCKKHGVTVLSDEIHCDLTSSGGYVPYASASETCKMHSITCIAASKAFNLAGLQSAAVVVPNPHLREKIVRGLNSDEVAEPNCFAVEATVAAFNEGEAWLNELNEYILANRNYATEFLHHHLPEMRVIAANATYLLWMDCSAYTSDSDDLCGFLREKTGLVLSSGAQYRGNGNLFLRMNLACSRSRLEDGLLRLERGITDYRRK